jgi:hypothetical protein
MDSSHDSSALICICTFVTTPVVVVSLSLYISCSAVVMTCSTSLPLVLLHRCLRWSVQRRSGILSPFTTTPVLSTPSSTISTRLPTPSYNSLYSHTRRHLSYVNPHANDPLAGQLTFPLPIHHHLSNGLSLTLVDYPLTDYPSSLAVLCSSCDVCCEWS